MSNTNNPPSVSVLDGFEVRTRGRPVELPITAQRVLGYLAVSGTSQPRDLLAGKLWSFTSQARAQANLRTALWQLRRADPHVVDDAHGQVSFRDGIEVDYRTMTTEAHRLIRDGMSRQELLDVPIHQFEAELLPGWDEEWLLIDRERHRQLRIHALEALSERLTDLGEFALAIEAAYAAVAVEPLYESAQRALVRAFLVNGNRAEALRQFRLYSGMLLAETGLDPSQEFVALLGAPPPTRSTTS